MKNTINTTEIINRLKNEFGPVNYTVKDLGRDFEIESTEREGLYEYRMKNKDAQVKVITVSDNGFIIAQFGITETHQVKF
jgi:hypothetical protein